MTHPQAVSRTAAWSWLSPAMKSELRRVPQPVPSYCHNAQESQDHSKSFPGKLQRRNPGLRVSPQQGNSLTIKVASGKRNRRFRMRSLPQLSSQPRSARLREAHVAQADEQRRTKETRE